MKRRGLIGVVLVLLVASVGVVTYRHKPCLGSVSGVDGDIRSNRVTIQVR